MKQIITMLALALPFLAIAQPHNPHEAQIRQRAIVTAQGLAQELNAISQEAARVSFTAQKNGNTVRANRFRDLSYKTGNVSVEVRRRVAQPLRNGVALRIVSREVENLRWQFRQVESALSVIQQLPPNIDRNVREAKGLYQRLKTLLRVF